VVPADPRHSQTYITLTPIVIRKTDNKFAINNEYDSQIMISPISQTVRGDNLLDYEYVQLYFSNTEINIMVTPQTIWDALRDIGGLLSLMLFFASFAGMRHIYQFNDSLRKSFQRASRAFRRHNRRRAASPRKQEDDDEEVIDDEVNLSTSTTASQKRDLKDAAARGDNQFRDEFSFGSYLHLVWRVEYLEG
jgi:hypothetical protein